MGTLPQFSRQIENILEFAVRNFPDLTTLEKDPSFIFVLLPPCAKCRAGLGFAGDPLPYTPYKVTSAQRVFYLVALCASVQSTPRESYL